MKENRSLISGLVSCGIALVMVASVSAQSVQQGTAKVVSIKGSARYMAASNASWQPLKAGTILRPGAILQTASGSYVDLILNNPHASGPILAPMSATPEAGPASGMSYHPKAHQDAVRVFENTVLGVDKLTLDQTGVQTVTDTQLDLKAGSIFFTVKKLSAGSKYEVKIPNGVAGVRGSAVFLSAQGVIQVIEGQVVLAFTGKEGVVTKVINAGRQFDIQTGEETFVGPQILGEFQRWMRELPIGQVTPMEFARDFTFIPVSAIRNANPHARFLR
jgi:FecR protein